MISVKGTPEYFMMRAYEQARIAGEDGEAPVGAVIVLNGRIISSGRNRREKNKNALAHAEIEAISKACKKLKSWRLTDCEIYVTLEPCPMCAGAIINARIPKVYIGTDDPKGGACGSVVNVFEEPFNHTPQVTRGLMRDECAQILRDFFRKLRGR